MYLACDVVKNLKTDWNETMTIAIGFANEEPDNVDFFITTDTLDITFSVIVTNFTSFFEKLEFYLPFHKDFLLSLNSNNYTAKNFPFPAKSNEQNLMVAENIRKFVKKGKKNKFRDYAALKTKGRDQYSSMKLPALKEKMTPKNINQVKKYSLDEKPEAAVYRWILRGLPVDMAIHKIKVDLEISENARRSKVAGS